MHLLLYVSRDAKDMCDRLSDRHSKASSLAGPKLLLWFGALGCALESKWPETGPAMACRLEEGVGRSAGRCFEAALACKQESQRSESHACLGKCSGPGQSCTMNESLNPLMTCCKQTVVSYEITSISKRGLGCKNDAAPKDI